MSDSPHPKRAFAAAFAVLIAVACRGSSLAGEPSTTQPATVGDSASRPSPSTEPSDCSACHECSAPTRFEPCLRGCARHATRPGGKNGSPDFGPQIVVLDELEDRYLPVPFDHKGHATMAEMTQGCSVCHHYTPEGVEHPACKNCHEVTRGREDMRKPSLKGAYHRQCMSCHREWSHEAACEVCHKSKVGRAEPALTTTRPSKDDIVGRMHPPIPEPDTEIYEPRSQPVPGEKIVFRHREHIHRFGLRCVECHREDNCARCHEEGRTHMQRARTLNDHHQPCATCHDVTTESGCKRCHWKTGRPRPAPFDHVSTGWPLKPYHEDKGCRACHKTVPFTALDRNCEQCHRGWTTGKFDHAATGQILDSNHDEADCADCHTEGRYDRPPSCGECHDEDSGIAFPKRRPGPTARPVAEPAVAEPPRDARRRGQTPTTRRSDNP